MKGFYITFIYRIKQELQRKGLWEDLKNIANSMDDAWCILGNFMRCKALENVSQHVNHKKLEV